jgi:DNA-binding PadR family transcriptional regulator
MSHTLTSYNKSSSTLIMNSAHRRSPLALTVLALLYEAPMHPYRMQQLIKERGKDEVVNVRQRASIYQTIERLRRLGLITPRETVREERWPEWTDYEMTDEGRRTFHVWMNEALSTPAREFPEFPVAVSLLGLLTPEEALRLFETRVAALEDEAARIDSQFKRAAAEGLPRLFLLETEYQRATFEAELEWVRAVVDDLRTGRLTWSEEWLSQFSEQPMAAADVEEQGMT